MLPTYKSGDVVIATRYFIKLKPQNIIILHFPSNSRLVIKRIKKNEGHRYFVNGDNEMESTDSRQLGWIGEKHIVGKVIYQLK